MPNGWRCRRCPTRAGCCAGPTTARCWPAARRAPKATWWACTTCSPAAGARAGLWPASCAAGCWRRRCGGARHGLPAGGQHNTRLRARSTAAGLRRRLRLPLPVTARPDPGDPVSGSRAPATRRRPGARSSPARRRRWRPCPGCPGALQQHLAVVGEHEQVDAVAVVAGLHVEESRSPAWTGRAAAAPARSARRRSAAPARRAPIRRWRPARQLAQVQRHRDRQSLVEVATTGMKCGTWASPVCAIISGRCLWAR
jgi:hypothetical protein